MLTKPFIDDHGSFLAQNQTKALGYPVPRQPAQQALYRIKSAGSQSGDALAKAYEGPRHATCLYHHVMLVLALAMATLEWLRHRHVAPLLGARLLGGRSIAQGSA